LNDKMYRLFFIDYILIHLIYFFFSSRRRHTRSDRDWSSDVCSSDLVGGGPDRIRASDEGRQLRVDGPQVGRAEGGERPSGGHARSEERRVGKEWRSRWSPCH